MLVPRWSSARQACAATRTEVRADGIFTGRWPGHDGADTDTGKNGVSALVLMRTTVRRAGGAPGRFHPRFPGD